MFIWKQSQDPLDIAFDIFCASCQYPTAMNTKLLKTISTIKKVIFNLQARHSTGVVELPAKEKIQSNEYVFYMTELC